MQHNLTTAQCLRRYGLRAILTAALLTVSSACGSMADEETTRWREAEQDSASMDALTGPPIGIDKLDGMTLAEVQAMSPPAVTYQMSARPSATFFYNHAQIATSVGWPIHALQWKDYTSPPAFDINAAVSALVSAGWGVNPMESVELNNAEANPAVFATDPAGEWLEEAIVDPAEALVFAALAMHYWKTPVYMAALHFPTQTGVTHAIGLQMLEFTIPSAANLHAACGLPTSAPPAIALSTIPACNHGAVLTSNEVSLWQSSFPGTPPWYTPNTSLLTYELVNAYLGLVIYDPPADATSEDVEGLREIAASLADQVLIPDEEGVLVPLRGYERTSDTSATKG